MKEKRRDNLISGGIALASIFVLAWVIPSFTPPYPGYGVSSALLPNVVFGVILTLSLLLLVTNILADRKAKASGSKNSPPAEMEIPPDKKVHLWHFISFMVPCVLLFPAMKLIGFIPASLVFLILMQYFCGQRKPVTMIIVSVCTVGAIYIAMRFGLGVPLP